MVNELKIIAIIQCRMTSSRLPAKAMLDLGGKTLLERVIECTKKSKFLDEIWVATSNDKFDDLIEWKSIQAGCNVFRGDLDDALNRYAQCAIKAHADIIVRVTADNPLTSPHLIDFAVKYIVANKCDYVSFNDIPYGAGVEAFRMSALLYANKKCKSIHEREHVTTFITNNANFFKIKLVDCPIENIRRPGIRVTIDTLDDYKVMAKYFGIINDCNYNLADFIKLFDEKRL